MGKARFIRKTLMMWLIASLAAAASSCSTSVSVLQWNIWQEGTMVEGGYDAIVDEIVRLHPDFVTFSEVRNYNGTRFCDRITQSLRERGETYYSFFSYDTGLLSRHPIIDSVTVFPCVEDHGSVYGLRAKVGRRRIAVYTAHLDYLNDSYYEARGYDGNTFRPIAPISNADTLIAHGNRSRRNAAIAAFLRQAELDAAEGYNVVIGGDFNEPSHLDWTSATASRYDHHGAVVRWPVTSALEAAGFTDVYRAVHPDVLLCPGFTYPSDNAGVAPRRLTWAPTADERDRIDYVFCRPAPGHRVRPDSALVFGPEGCIVRSERVVDPSADPRLLPLGVWPTDHKGVWTILRLR